VTTVYYLTSIVDVTNFPKTNSCCCNCNDDAWFSARRHAGSLALSCPRDEMSEVVSRCLPRRQLWVSNLSVACGRFESVILLLQLTINCNWFGGRHRSRVVTFTAIRLRGPGLKPRPGQKSENENFCFRRTPAVVKACHPCRVGLIKTPLYKAWFPILSY